MFDPEAGPVSLELTASPPRRYVGVGMLALLGGLLVFLSVSLPFGIGQIVILAVGILALWGATRQYTATAQVLELTETEFRVIGGPVLAGIEDIEKVERGAFAFKPSNGFLVTLKTSSPRRWAPGLFWCMGRRIGVGGVTGAPQTKAMAEAMAGLIAMRSDPKPE
jgi:hypothetical protein